MNDVAKITFFDVLFFVLAAASVIMSAFLQKQQLYIIVPAAVLALIITYIHKTKKKANLLFIAALIAVLVSNFFSLYNFDRFYLWITNLTTLHLVLFSVVLKKYLKKGTLKSFLKSHVIISFGLILYIIYTVLSFLMEQISDNELFFSLICAISIVVFMFTVSVIYINDVYENCLNVLTSGILLFFQMGLSTINEYLYFNKFFTVLIIITHFVAIYFLMKFIVETKVSSVKNTEERFV